MRDTAHRMLGSPHTRTGLHGSCSLFRADATEAGKKEHPSCVHPEAIGSPYLAKRMRYYENFVLPVLKTGVKAAERIA